MGSHGTPIQVIVDTGSADTIIQTNKNSYCQQHGGCAKYGTIDLTSQSLKLLRRAGIKIGYISGLTATADLVTDVISIGGQPVPDAEFGIATSANFEYNVLGLGYAANEAVVGRTYMNFPQKLKSNGLIKSVSYSLFLNSQNAGSGFVLFGGIDTGKFKGKLTTVAVQGSRQEVIIKLSEVSFGAVNGGSFRAVLDAGQTSISVGNELAKQIWAAAGIKSLNQNGDPIRSCALSDAESKMALVLQIGATLLRVAMSELVYPDPTETGDSVRLDPGLCYFGVYGSGTTAVLGIPFLRSAYVVINLEKNEVSLAQANYNGASNIIEVADGGVRSLGDLADGVDEGTLSAEITNFAAGDNPINAGDGNSETGDISIPSTLAFNPGSNMLSTQVSTDAVGNPSIDKGSINANPADGATQISSTNAIDNLIFTSPGGSSDISNPFFSPEAPGANTPPQLNPGISASQVASSDTSTPPNTAGQMMNADSPPSVDSNNYVLSQLDPTTNWVTLSQQGTGTR